MQRTIPMPKLGMTMTEGTLVQWHVAPGDTVAKDDVLADVETDKVVLEVEAPCEGTVAELLAEAGAVIPVGEPLLVINASAATDETDVTIETAPGTAPGTAPEDAVALAGQDGAGTGRARDAELSPNGVYAAGNSANGTASVLSPSTPTTTATGSDTRRIPMTPAARRVAHELGVDPSQVVAESGGRRQNAPLHANDILRHPRETPAPLPQASTGTAPTLTPLARKIAEEHGLSAADLTSTAPTTKRIGREQVEAALATQVTSAPQATATATRTPAVTVGATTGTTGTGSTASAEGTFTPLTSMRRIIAERTGHSFSTVPHIYLDLEVDMTEAEALRARLRVAHPQGPTPSVTAVLLKCVAAALAQHPEINASFLPATEQHPAGIQQWADVNVGVAVALDDGLLVPVIRQADRKSLAQISRELNELASQARAGKLKPDDLAGSTFSVSNLGAFGLDTFHAVINEPNSAILAVGRVRRQPMVVELPDGSEEVRIRPMMKLSLSADHRVVDGAAGARFLKTLREYVEEPCLLI